MVKGCDLNSPGSDFGEFAGADEDIGDFGGFGPFREVERRAVVGDFGEFGEIGGGGFGEFVSVQNSEPNPNYHPNPTW